MLGQVLEVLQRRVVDFLERRVAAQRSDYDMSFALKIR
jgi:hypothetical protein